MITRTVRLSVRNKWI